MVLSCQYLVRIWSGASSIAMLSSSPLVGDDVGHSQTENTKERMHHNSTNPRITLQTNGYSSYRAYNRFLPGQVLQSLYYRSGDIKIVEVEKKRNTNTAIYLSELISTFITQTIQLRL